MITYNMNNMNSDLGSQNNDQHQGIDNDKNLSNNLIVNIEQQAQLQ